jgi:branched-chain amino acid transport system ATP-binding protein
MSDYLIIEHVTAGYAATTILDDVSLRIGEHDSCAVLGRNGVGKTTLLATIMGHTELHRGSIRLGGREIALLPAHRRARAGIGFVPQEREIFPSLTVEENLTVAMRRGAWPVERIYELFPRLAERRRNRGGQLSGGEQQMLSIGRALMGDPKLLLMDEPLEGLAPVLSPRCGACARRRRLPLFWSSSIRGGRSISPSRRSSSTAARWSMTGRAPCCATILSGCRFSSASASGAQFEETGPRRRRCEIDAARQGMCSRECACALKLAGCRRADCDRRHSLAWRCKP